MTDTEATDPNAWIFCPTCGVPLSRHNEEMKRTCAIFDLSQPYAPSPPTGHAPGAEEVGPGQDTRRAWPEADDPQTEMVTQANILFHWAVSVRGELEDLGEGRFLPYRTDAQTPPEDLVRLLVALGGVAGTEDSGLIGILRDLGEDVKAALASKMSAKAETIAGMDIERHFGTKRTKWEREQVAKEVLAVTIQAMAARDDADKLDSRTAAVASTLVHTAYSKAFRFEPRAGALRELGIDADLYCESEPGRPGVIVRKHRITEDE